MMFKLPSNPNHSTILKQQFIKKPNSIHQVFSELKETGRLEACHPTQTIYLGRLMDNYYG